jgi:flagellar biosynthesis protein FlhF
MNMKRFFAPSSREALRHVKVDLGNDAVILSNRRVEGGVEILAIPHADARALDATARESKPAIATQVRTALNNPVMQPARPVNWKASAPQLAPPPGPAPAGADQIARTVIREIQSMRGLIHEQLSTLVFGDMQKREPDKLRMMSALLGGGFSPALARKFMEKAPVEGGMPGLRAWVKKALDHNLVTSAADEIVTRGGVYALLGPTGVGKTTTTAKLAARCVVRQGADKLALLTTDNYRVGAHEHLRIYGRILGVAVHAVRDDADLQAALADLRGKHMVLIDTVGMSQKDKHVADQVAMFSGHGNVRRLLLLNATSQGDTLEDVVRAYGARGLAGCIISKADEAASLGAVLDTVIRHRLAVHYVANGQRVPEDIHPVNRDYLLHRAIGAARDNGVREFGEQDVSAAMFGAEAAF